MPAARLGALRFYISSDDLLIPYVINSILFACVIITFMVGFVHADVMIIKFASHCHQLPGQVSGYPSLQIDGYVLLALFFLQLFASVGCAWFANKGAILQMKIRQSAVPLALASSMLSVLQIPVLGIFIWLAYKVSDSASCESLTFQALREADVTTTDPLSTLKTLCWVVLGFVVVGPVVKLSLLNLYPSFRATAHGCCSGLAHCFGFTDALSDTEGGDYSIKDEFSAIMVRLFGPMPLVASDLVAGMILVSCYQFRQRQVALLAAQPSEEPSRRSSFDEVADTAAGLLTPPNLPLTDAEVTQAADSWPCSAELGMPVDAKTLCEAEYFLHFAEAAYGDDTTAMYGKLARTQVTDALKTTSVPKPPVAPEPVVQADHWLEFWRRLIKDPFHHPFRSTQKEDSQQPSRRERNKRLKRWNDALVGQLGLEESDILDMQLENQALGIVPYYIALDRIRDTIIVSIRGSYSIEDAVTDLVTTPAPLSTLLSRGGLWAQPQSSGEEGGSARHSDDPATAVGTSSDTVQVLIESEEVVTPRADSTWKAVINQSEEANDEGHLVFDQAVYPGGYCHRGILMSAVRLLDRIRERGVLAATITDHPGWKVVITGHSLGAGLATLLTMALEPELHGRLKCWSFCPPGGLLSVELAISTAPYVTSIVHAKDMVSRMTWRSLERLRDEVMTSVAMCKINKNELWWRR